LPRNQEIALGPGQYRGSDLACDQHAILLMILDWQRFDQVATAPCIDPVQV